jgi:hypothetical protein
MNFHTKDSRERLDTYNRRAYGKLLEKDGEGFIIR